MRHASYPQTPHTFDQLIMAHAETTNEQAQRNHEDAALRLARDILRHADEYTDDQVWMAALAINNIGITRIGRRNAA